MKQAHILAATLSVFFASTLLTSRAFAVAGFAQLGAGASDVAGQCLGRHGEDVDQRIQFCTKASAMNAFAGEVWPWLGLALAYGSQGKYDLALTDIETAVKYAKRNDDPNMLGVFATTCQLRAINGQPLDQAVTDCDKALAIDPKYTPALDYRASIEYRLGRYADTVTDTSVVIQINAKADRSLYLRGLAENKLGNTAAGAADIAAAQAINPNVGQNF